jgi:hypothetical protein
MSIKKIHATESSQGDQGVTDFAAVRSWKPVFTSFRCASPNSASNHTVRHAFPLAEPCRRVATITATKADRTLEIPETVSWLNPLLTSVTLQLLSVWFLWLAVEASGLDMIRNGYRVSLHQRPIVGIDHADAAGGDSGSTARNPSARKMATARGFLQQSTVRSRRPLNPAFSRRDRTSDNLTSIIQPKMQNYAPSYDR